MKHFTCYLLSCQPMHNTEIRYLPETHQLILVLLLGMLLPASCAKSSFQWGASNDLTLSNVVTWWNNKDTESCVAVFRSSWSTKPQSISWFHWSSKSLLEFIVIMTPIFGFLGFTWLNNVMCREICPLSALLLCTRICSLPLISDLCPADWTPQNQSCTPNLATSFSLLILKLIKFESWMC